MLPVDRTARQQGPIVAGSLVDRGRSSMGSPVDRGRSCHKMPGSRGLPEKITRTESESYRPTLGALGRGPRAHEHLPQSVLVDGRPYRRAALSDKLPGAHEPLQRPPLIIVGRPCRWTALAQLYKLTGFGRGCPSRVWLFRLRAARNRTTTALERASLVCLMGLDVTLLMSVCPIPRGCARREICRRRHLPSSAMS